MCTFDVSSNIVFYWHWLLMVSYKQYFKRHLRAIGALNDCYTILIKYTTPDRIRADTKSLRCNETKHILDAQSPKRYVTYTICEKIRKVCRKNCSEV